MFSRGGARNVFRNHRIFILIAGAIPHRTSTNFERVQLINFGRLKLIKKGNIVRGMNFQNIKFIFLIAYIPYTRIAAFQQNIWSLL
jgi:hypothetical protein